MPSRHIGGQHSCAQGGGTRQKCLHFAVGAPAAYCPYVRHCAEFLDACLRAPKCPIETRLRGELSQDYSADSFRVEDPRLHIPAGAIRAAEGTKTLLSHWSRTYWVCPGLAGRPNLVGCSDVPSIHVSSADGVNKSASGQFAMSAMQMNARSSSQYACPRIFIACGNFVLQECHHGSTRRRRLPSALAGHVTAATHIN